MLVTSAALGEQTSWAHDLISLDPTPTHLVEVLGGIPRANVTAIEITTICTDDHD